MNNSLIILGIHRIIFVGKTEYPERQTVFSSKRLHYHEMIFQFSGKTKVFFNNEELTTCANTIRYLPEGECKKYVIDQKEGPEYIDIFFSSNVPLSKNAFVMPAKSEKIATLFKKIFTVWVQKNEGYYFECISILYKIIAEMQKTSYIPDSQFEKIKPAIDYIQNNFLSKEIITAEKLSLVCGISYSYIKRIFALKFKISPKRYILQLKMNYACDLLLDGSRSVSQIAEMCGFSDIYYFSHQFKKEFGLSPKDFIEKYKSSK